MDICTYGRIHDTGREGERKRGELEGERRKEGRKERRKERRKEVGGSEEGRSSLEETPAADVVAIESPARALLENFKDGLCNQSFK